MIEGVKIEPLTVLSNDQGKVMPMVKSTDLIFREFGEIYFSMILPGKIKGWHKRKKATRNYVVVEGNVKLVLYDGKEIQEIVMGENNYCLVTIPPGIWSSFKAMDERKAIVADLADIPYDPQDSVKVDIFTLADYWKRNRD